MRPTLPLILACLLAWAAVNSTAALAQRQRTAATGRPSTSQRHLANQYASGTQTTTSDGTKTTNMFIHSGPNRGGLHTTIVQTNGIRFTKKAYFTSTPTGKTLLAKLPSGTSVAGSERRSATGTSSSMIQWQGGTSPMATVVKTILFVATAHAAPTWRGGPYGETTSPMADRMTDYLLGH